MAGPCFFLLSAAADHREVVVAAAGEDGYAPLKRCGRCPANTPAIVDEDGAHLLHVVVWRRRRTATIGRLMRTHYPDRDKGRLAEPPFVVASVSHSIPTDHKLG